MRPFALMWTGSMLAVLFIVLSEELFGAHRATDLPRMLSAYGGYVLLPLLVAFRFVKNEKAKKA